MSRRLNVPGLVFLAALALLWQGLAFYAASPNFPTFTQVIGALIENRVALGTELRHTLLRTSVGFGVALLVALPLGIMLGRIRALGDIIAPVIELLRPLPPVAVIPVSMIFLGIGDAAKIAVVIYGASFPILINSIDAVRAQDPMLSRVARSIRLTRHERMWLVDLPAAMPRIVAGIRISLAISILLAVVAEMLLSTNGLGAFLTQAQESFETANVLAVLLLIALVALTVNAVARGIEHRLIRWHHIRGAT